MEYRDFDLRLREGPSGDWLADVRAPDGAESATAIRFSHKENTLRERLSRFERQVLGSRGVHLPDSPDSCTVAPRDPEAFGEEIFRALIRGQAADLYRVSLAQAREAHLGLRIRLSNEIPALAAVPWEFMYDRDEGGYLALSTETPLVRYLRLPRPVYTLGITPPLRILGVVASPRDLPELGVDDEIQRIEEATRAVRDDGAATLEWVETATWRELQRALRRGPWHILHYIGHGDFDAQNGEGLLALEDESGESFKLHAPELSGLLADHPSLRLCVLNSCSGARGDGEDRFSSTASALMRRGLPAVVAMQYQIGDKAAVSFSQALYEALAEGVAIDRAVGEARKAMRIEARSSLEWGTPVLHMRSSDGVLFQVGSVASPTPKPTPRLPGPSPPIDGLQPTGDAADKVMVTSSPRPGKTGVQFCLDLARDNMWWKGLGFGASETPKIEGEGQGLKGCVTMDPAVMIVHFHKAKVLGVHKKVGEVVLDLREYDGHTVSFSWLAD